MEGLTFKRFADLKGKSLQLYHKWGIFSSKNQRSRSRSAVVKAKPDVMDTSTGQEPIADKKEIGEKEVEKRKSGRSRSRSRQSSGNSNASSHHSAKRSTKRSSSSSSTSSSLSSASRSSVNSK